MRILALCELPRSEPLPSMRMCGKFGSRKARAAPELWKRMKPNPRDSPAHLISRHIDMRNMTQRTIATILDDPDIFESFNLVSRFQTVRDLFRKSDRKRPRQISAQVQQPALCRTKSPRRDHEWGWPTSSSLRPDGNPSSITSLFGCPPYLGERGRGFGL